MPDNDHPSLAVPLLERGMTRRKMLLTTGGALAGVLLVGCGGGEGAQKSASPVAGSFVGEMPDMGERGAFVAVVAAGAEEEAEEREVRAYLCDGREITEWFWGSAEGNDLSLTSEGGAQLEGALAPGTATGTITLADGGSFPFEAPLATGVAGLYDVVWSSDGAITGTSETGGRIEAQLGEEVNTDILRVSGTITPPEGEPVELETFARYASPGEYRFIVLPDGEVKGSKKGKSTGSTTDWYDPTTDP